MITFKQASTLSTALLLGCGMLAAFASDGAPPDGNPSAPAAPSAAPPAPAKPVEPVKLPDAERPVDLAICLDTSNSMDGLIDSAKRRIWDVVTELSRLSPRPRLRVALVSYGNTSYSVPDGWVRMDAPFTEDLDFISERLFALRTNGGEEYVARVLDTSLARLSWSDDPKALRVCLVAGNESADQDRVVTYADACEKAARRGIIVNTIYCGPESNPESAGWKDFATQCSGKYTSIDQEKARKSGVASTPFDTSVTNVFGDYLRATGAWTGSDAQLQSKAPGLVHLIAGSPEYQFI